MNFSPQKDYSIYLRFHENKHYIVFSRDAWIDFDLKDKFIKINFENLELTIVSPEKKKNIHRLRTYFFQNKKFYDLLSISNTTRITITKHGNTIKFYA